ncbi:hypothetical protein F4811DRAFT_563731 [Daldinia bambusicola]|nr:hypothetical protein F4811DRAFT_563731 [Daldinia bambusicola]
MARYGLKNTRINLASYLVKLRKELQQLDEECFGWASAKYMLGDIKLEEYFHRLVDHLEEGGASHTWDEPGSNIEDNIRTDLIAGAFKSTMLNGNIGRISHADAEQLQNLCLLFYREAEVAELQRRIELDVAVTLDSLPPWTIDILGMVAYARRHVEVLEHLIQHYRASITTSPTSFDLIGRLILGSRKRQSDHHFQHSPNPSNSREMEWRVWTALLEAEPGAWLHYPLSKTKEDDGLDEGLPMGLYWALQSLVDDWKEEHELRASPLLARFLNALGARGNAFDASRMSRFFSVTEGTSFLFPNGGPFIPVGVAPARAMLESSPLETAFRKDYRGADSANVALPITQWPIDNEDRLAVMEMLLKQGLVVDGKISEYGGYITERMTQDHLNDTCLIKAAERGDADMVRLLLSYGASKDVQGGNGHTAAQRARVKGHTEVADYLESPQG